MRASARGKPAPERSRQPFALTAVSSAKWKSPMGQTPPPARDLLRTIRAYAQACTQTCVSVDAIGAVSILGDSGGALQHPWSEETSDIRLRFAAQSSNAAEVELLLDEVEALYCAGPAGGAGVRRRMTPRLASASCLIERKYAEPRVTMLGGSA